MHTLVGMLVEQGKHLRLNFAQTLGRVSSEATAKDQG